MKEQPYLILIKHALPDIWPRISAHEWALSEQGRTDSLRLANRLAQYNPRRVFSSPEPKAHETASILAAKLQVPLVVNDNLHEHSRQQVSFESPAGFNNRVRELFSRPDSLVFGEETANQAHDRFTEALIAILKMYPKETVAVVSHGTVISLFVSRRCNQPAFPLWEQLGLPAYILLSRPELDLVEVVATI